ncbi:hypothetical protein DMC61_21825 [Amycolatopsis sp. WAC 04169]|uniref:enediyne antibiotic chromoprotein n=1 Tax=Amycolatopsis sp. WAC 04169 TaxID=2203197 RepID=UPI000F798607|nr:enediyne antibiotic chromoprotein [Amycolatopsis sp. WAC 04169]RSN29145.1 hypothetical protein DMC61_21825 [Amycolatopsis sp. WAC 04169]
MTISSIRRIGKRVGAMAFLVAGLTFFGTSPALALQPSLTVSPTTGIADGQTLSVTGSGFGANATVHIVECSLNGGVLACNLGNGDAKTVTADSNGQVAAGLPVRKVYAGVDPVTGNPTGQVDCGAAPGCIVVASVDGSSTATDPVAISFQ